MSPKKILAVVVNYDHNLEAMQLKQALSTQFETIVIDSGSPVQLEAFDIKLENVGYSGLFNAAVTELVARDHDWLYLMCSDVEIGVEDVATLRHYMDQLDDDVGVYSPSATGRCRPHCRNAGSGGLRDVFYVEGYTFLAHRSVLGKMYPVDVGLNRHGWGLDVCKGHLCKMAGLRCVIDDRIAVHHQSGTGYNSRHARAQMLSWMDSAPIAGLRHFWDDVEQRLGL